ncbi:MAG: RHS repeat-associated core domain-containing protein [Thiothrix sp.]|nr:MAG: RHS repeat-associated core domain-containing protein [Thiothrix sp.]
MSFFGCSSILTLSQTNENGQLETYHYNSRQELIGHTVNGQTTHYTYNAEGIRTQQGNATQSTTYLIDQNRDYAQVVAEYESAGLKKSYSYGDDLVSQTEGTATHYYHYDGLGSTRALSDTSGTLTDTYAYDAFGDVLSQTGTTDNTYRFTGEQYDASLDQYYLRARYYDQGVGRFTQQDSWMGDNSDPITLHKYLYANSDPVNHTDPSGQFGLASLSISMNLHSSLAMGQFDAGLNLINTSLNRGENYSDYNGWAVLASLSPLAIAKVSNSIKVVSNMSANGKVAYLASKPPLAHEIDTASYIAEKLGVGIYIRGGESSPGADAFISGVKWELKRSKKATARSVKSSIDDAIDQMEAHNTGSPIRIVIDGRIGVTDEMFQEGISKVQSTKRNRITEIMFIRADGEIISWPF